MEMINDRNIDVLCSLQAMRLRENSTTPCRNYFQECSHDENDDVDVIDESCRSAMVTWVQQVQQTLSLSPETVWIATSFLDRYLSSGRGNSRHVLKSKSEFQLAAITAYYTAVKIYEPVVMSIEMLLLMCRGTYEEADFVAMEKDILSALGWAVSVHTPMDFARHLLELLSEEELPRYVSNALLDGCLKHLEVSMSDIYSSCCRPSVVGISCLSRALAECELLGLTEKLSIWMTLSRTCQSILSSEEVFAARRCLLSSAASPLCNSSDGASMMPTTLSPQSCSATFVYGADGESSPVCVARAARQA